MDSNNTTKPWKTFYCGADEADTQIVTEVTLEAVMSKRHQTLHWRDLSDETRWKAGWL